ncbi:MAG TPA: ATP-binding cassette domain-containing protein, partial [Limnochorda sp.]
MHPTREAHHATTHVPGPALVAAGADPLTAPAAAQPLAGTGQPLLELREVSMVFGGLVAVNGLNLSLKEGELVGLIGPNGAGKTTVFNM